MFSTTTIFLLPKPVQPQAFPISVVLTVILPVCCSPNTLQTSFSFFLSDLTVSLPATPTDSTCRIHAESNPFPSTAPLPPSSGSLSLPPGLLQCLLTFLPLQPFTPHSLFSTEQLEQPLKNIFPIISFLCSKLCTNLDFSCQLKADVLTKSTKPLHDCPQEIYWTPSPRNLCSHLSFSDHLGSCSSLLLPNTPLYFTIVCNFFPSKNFLALYSYHLFSFYLW